MRPAPPLLLLLPALALLPVLLALPALSHGGGWDLISQFAWAALTPSLDPLVLHSVLQGLGVTVGMALLGWASSLVLGLALGLISSRLIWRQLCGSAAPAELIRRLLALPRSIHELIWGLLLLQLVGLQPAVAVVAIAIPFGALVARVVSDLLDALPTAPLQALRAAGTGPAGRGGLLLVLVVGLVLFLGVHSSRFLAADFRDHGYSVRRLLKTIVLSKTYRQSSRSTTTAHEQDPDNRWLARQGRFRLDAELVRDNALMVSGLLVPTIGGRSVFPYQPIGYWAYLNFPTREWPQSTGDALYRRGLYTHWQRQYLQIGRAHV